MPPLLPFPLTRFDIAATALFAASFLVAAASDSERAFSLPFSVSCSSMIVSQSIPPRCILRIVAIVRFWVDSLC